MKTVLGALFLSFSLVLIMDCLHVSCYCSTLSLKIFLFLENLRLDRKQNIFFHYE